MTENPREGSHAWRAAVIAVVLLPLYYATLLLSDDVFTWLILEDHPIEVAGALGLLAASVLCVLIFRRYDGAPRLLRIALVLLALVLFFGAGEEISWGQRIVGLETPDSIVEVNKQDEINVHNLETFSGLLSVERLFTLFWVVMGVLLPLLALWRPARERLSRLVPILPAPLAIAFVLNQVLSSGATRVLDGSDAFKSTEVSLGHSSFELKETAISLLLALGFWVWYRAVREREPART